ncbi:MAG: hypothetical protein AB7T37_01520 [Dehalococcoidia bacterium]
MGRLKWTLSVELRDHGPRLSRELEIQDTAGPMQGVVWATRRDAADFGGADLDQGKGGSTVRFPLTAERNSVCIDEVVGRLAGVIVAQRVRTL